MSKKDEISVVIPTYNRIDTLIKVIPSYLNQKYLRELIIVDDGSKDKTEFLIKNLMKKNKKIKYIKNKNNGGAPYSRNRGVEGSIGSYIFFGEDDLELSENQLSVLLNHLKKNEADIIAGRRIWMRKGESKEQSLSRADKLKSSPINSKLIITNCEVKIPEDTKLPLLDASMLIKKEVFHKVKYDENYKKNAWREETDFQVCAGSKGFKLIYCPHTYCFHLAKKNDKGGNHSARILRYELGILKNNYYFINKNYKFIRKEFKIEHTSIHFLYFFLYRLKKSFFEFGSIVKKRVLILFSKKK